MSEESTTPDPVELARDLLESVDRDCDLDALADCFERDAVMDMSRLAVGNREGWAAIGVEARAAAERLAEQQG
jgi:hypothetical protein